MQSSLPVSSFLRRALGAPGHCWRSGRGLSSGKTRRPQGFIVGISLTGDLFIEVFFIAALLSGLALATGCDEPASSRTARTEVSSGKLEFALGNEVDIEDLADADCRPIDPESTPETPAAADMWAISVPAASSIKISSQNDGESLQRPTLLSARLPAELFSAGASKTASEITFDRRKPMFSAIASAYQVKFKDDLHESIQLLAESARDMTDYACRVHRVLDAKQGDQQPARPREQSSFVLACNQALAFPWQSANPRPEGSFRATFRCADAGISAESE